ncbi:MAG: hypothetical protein WAT39_07505 [Planctomycetota bacterium]
MTGFVIAAFVVLAIGAAFLAWRAEQQRIQAMQALAAELGLHFDRGPDHDHDDRYAQFEIFRRGHSRLAKNTVSGAIELFGRRCEVQLGDFRYKVDSGSGKNKSTSTHHFSYLIVHPPWPSPSLLVRPEGFFDKVKGAFGFDDIDFESEEFSRKYWVTSDDKRFAYDVLHPRMMEFLLHEQPPMLDLEGGAMCVSDGQRRWQPEQFRQQIAFVRRFCELWPRHLLKDLES